MSEKDKKQHDILSLQRSLQRARCISSYTRRCEESRDLTVCITSSFVVVGTRADEAEVKPVVYLFIGYNCLLSFGWSIERLLIRRLLKRFEMKRCSLPTSECSDRTSITLTSLLQWCLIRWNLVFKAVTCKFSNIEPVECIVLI